MTTNDQGVLERCLTVYFKSLEKLKDNVMALFQCYHVLMKGKMDCESGEQISINSQAFSNAVVEALNRCDELETQLQGLESWVDLPIVSPSDISASFDEVSDDAQRLVDIFQQIQSALLSAVSEKALKEALPERQAAAEAARQAEQQRLQMMSRQAQQMPIQQQQQQPHYPPPTAQEVPDYSAGPSAGATFMQPDDQMGSVSEQSAMMQPTGSYMSHQPHLQHAYASPQLQRRAYGDVPSPYGHQQQFAVKRTGSDPNLIAQQHQQYSQQQQQQQHDPSMHLQQGGPTSGYGYPPTGEYG